MREFSSYGRASVRPIDRLVVYKKTLQPDGVRMSIYDHVHRVATRKGRLPVEAQAVFDEIVKRQT